MSFRGWGGREVAVNLDPIESGGFKQQLKLIQAKPSELVLDLRNSRIEFNSAKAFLLARHESIHLEPVHARQPFLRIYFH